MTEANKRRWSREECRKKYVYSEEKIGYRELSRLSGRDVAQFTRWSDEDKRNGRGSWQEQRQRFENERQARTEEKTLERVCEAEADRLEKLIPEVIGANLSALRLARAAIAYEESCMMQAYKESEKNPNALQEFFQSLSPVKVNFYSLTIARNSEVLIQVAGLQKYASLQAAIACIERAGLEVQYPQQKGEREEAGEEDDEGD